jgi:hypothetical protein
LGVNEVKIEDARDADNPQLELIALINGATPQVSLEDMTVKELRERAGNCCLSRTGLT